MPEESRFHNEFSNSRIEHLIQAHLVQMQAPRPPKPMEVAPPPRHWVDREEELHKLELHLNESAPASVVIQGARGTGKTALAAMLAQRIAPRFPDGQLYIDLGRDKLLPAMRSVLLRLGEPREQLAESLGGLLSHYRSATKDQSLMVIVDGARTADEGGLFRPNSGTSALVVIGTDDLFDPDAHLQRIDDLNVERGAELLQGLCPWLSTEQSLHLVGSHSGNPGTLRRIAGLVRSRWPDGSGPRASDLPALQRIDTAELLDATYRELSRSASWLYRFLSVLPGDQFERSIMDVFQLPGGAEPEAFGELVNAQLVTETRPEWFRVESDVYRDASRRAQSERLPVELLTVMRQSMRWYVKRAQLADLRIMGDRLRTASFPEGVECPDFESGSAALAWLSDNHAALTSALRMAAVHSWNDEVHALAEAMWAFYANLPYPNDAEHCYRIALSAAESPGRRARMLLLLGKTITDLKRYSEAAEVLDEALALARRAQDGALEGSALELLGRMHYKQGRVREAIPLYEEALANAVERGRARSQAWQLMFLGQAHRDLGDRERARDCFARSLEQFIVAEDARTSVLARFELVLLDVEDEVPGAVETAERILGWMRDLGIASHEARAQERLGIALGGAERQRRLETAAEIFQRFGNQVEAERLTRMSSEPDEQS